MELQERHKVGVGLVQDLQEAAEILFVFLLQTQNVAVLVKNDALHTTALQGDVDGIVAQRLNIVHIAVHDGLAVTIGKGIGVKPIHVVVGPCVTIVNPQIVDAVNEAVPLQQHIHRRLLRRGRGCGGDSFSGLGLGGGYRQPLRQQQYGRQQSQKLGHTQFHNTSSISVKMVLACPYIIMEFFVFCKIVPKS